MMGTLNLKPKPSPIQTIYRNMQQAKLALATAMELAKLVLMYLHL
jgi:hypothetical protein